MSETGTNAGTWTILSNHGHALIYLVREPDIRIWELAQRLDIRERSAQRIVTELVEAGYVTRHPHPTHGSRVTYTVDRSKGLRRPDLNPIAIGDLLDTIIPRLSEASGSAAE